jgi:S1-C subfamily serine protease
MILNIRRHCKDLPMRAVARSSDTCKMRRTKEIAMQTNPRSDPLVSLSAACEAAVARAAPAVVSIVSGRSRSSGFVWRSRLVVTADESLADETDIIVIDSAGERRQAEIVGRDPTTDVALLRVPGLEAPPLIARQSPIGPGGLALVLGGSDHGVRAALGLVAVAGPAWQSLRGGSIDARIELDVAVARSSEGGPLLDAMGALAGMAVFGPRRRVLAIPTATIERVAQALERDRRIPRGYLGLALAPVRTSDDRGKGLIVMGVEAGGPGAASDLKQGDVIVAIDGARVESPWSLARSLGPGSVGRALEVAFTRAGESRTTSLTVAERPSA